MATGDDSQGHVLGRLKAAVYHPPEWSGEVGTDGGMEVMAME